MKGSEEVGEVKRRGLELDYTLSWKVKYTQRNLDKGIHFEAALSSLPELFELIGVFWAQCAKRRLDKVDSIPRVRRG